MAGLSQRDASVLGRFGAFCALEGLGSPTSALRDSAAIEAFLAIGCSGLMPHSLGTYRSVLVRLGGCTCRSTNPFPGSRASRPYNSFEVAALWSMAQHQPSSLRIANAKVALATMVGAGLHPGELAELCGQDVQSRRGQCRIVVGGARPRTVRVRAPYGQELLGLAKREKGYLFRPGARVRSAKNLIGEVCAALVRDHDEVALSARRARSTFICAHLRARTPLHMLCAMAGIVEVESLLRYARHVEGAPGSKAALRAEARRS
jgi:integrase